MDASLWRRRPIRFARERPRDARKPRRALRDANRPKGDTTAGIVNCRQGGVHRRLRAILERQTNRGFSRDRRSKECVGGAKKKNAITRTRFRAVLWNGVQRPRPAERPFGPNGTARSASIHPRNSFLERRKKKERRSALVATNPWERNEAGDGRNLVASSNPATPKYPRQSTYLANRPSLNSRGGKRKNREALNSTQHKNRSPTKKQGAIRPEQDERPRDARAQGRRNFAADLRPSRT